MTDNNAQKQTFGQKFSARLRGFSHFVYHEEPIEGDVPNKTRGLFMGRTGSSWAKIGLFYLIFYGFLAGFFAVMLTVFMTTVNQPEDGGPKLTQFIKNQAGLTRLDQKSLLEDYDSSDNSSITKYSNLVEAHLKKYNTSHHSGTACDPSNSKGIPAGSKPCVFDRILLGECSGINDTSFGLRERKPCIFIKINRVYGWVPEGSNGYLTLSCNQGTVIPPGFLISAFPFRRQKGYQAPIVAVKVDTTGGSKKKVECRLVGKGISVSDSYTASRAYGKIKIAVKSK